MPNGIGFRWDREYPIVKTVTFVKVSAIVQPINQDTRESARRELRAPDSSDLELDIGDQISWLGFGGQNRGLAGGGSRVPFV